MNHTFRPDFAAYSYNVIGFPHVTLKWSEEGHQINDCYVVIKGVIQNCFSFQRCHGNTVDFRNEIPRFEKWVRTTFADDVSAQG